MFRFASLLCFVAYTTLSAAHTVIVYPGWRGNNIHTNGTVSEKDETIIPGSIGINYNETSDSYGFPYGMQWMYPCTLSLSAFFSPSRGPKYPSCDIRAACPATRNTITYHNRKIEHFD